MRFAAQLRFELEREGEAIGVDAPGFVEPHVQVLFRLDERYDVALPEPVVDLFGPLLNARIEPLAGDFDASDDPPLLAPMLAIFVLGLELVQVICRTSSWNGSTSSIGRRGGGHAGLSPGQPGGAGQPDRPGRGASQTSSSRRSIVMRPACDFWGAAVCGSAGLPGRATRRSAAGAGRLGGRKAGWGGGCPRPGHPFYWVANRPFCPPAAALQPESRSIVVGLLPSAR